MAKKKTKREGDAVIAELESWRPVYESEMTSTRDELDAFKHLLGEAKKALRKHRAAAKRAAVKRTANKGGAK